MSWRKSSSQNPNDSPCLAQKDFPTVKPNLSFGYIVFVLFQGENRGNKSNGQVSSVSEKERSNPPFLKSPSDRRNPSRGSRKRKSK